MKKISPKVIDRSLVYIRTLDVLLRKGKDLISSQELAELTGLNDAIVRKDISNFRKVGRPGIGYDIDELKRMLENFILKEDDIHVVLFGVGNLGTAILRYPGFKREKLQIVAGFDKNEKKIGKKINGVEIFSIDDAGEVIKDKHGDVGIIAVPEEYAQKVADLLVKLEMKAILNFSPVSLEVPKEVHVKNIDFSIEFLSLFCQARGIE